MNAMKMTVVACSAVVCGALTAAESESEAEKPGFSLSDYVAGWRLIRDTCRTA